MARKKTKKQKIRAKHKQVLKSIRPKINSTFLETPASSKTPIKKIKTKSTTFTESQVSLLKKDLLKTLITTIIVVGILALIYFNLK